MLQLNVVYRKQIVHKQITTGELSFNVPGSLKLESINLSKDRKIKAAQRVFMFYALEGLKGTLASVEPSDLPRKSTGQAIDTVTATRCYRHLKIRS